MSDTKISMFAALRSSLAYRKYHDTQREALRQKRLREIVLYARQNSPYYQALYQNVKEDFSLSELPPVNKAALMSHWDDWVTDRNVTRKEITEFMKNPDHIGRRWNGKYLIYTTSGSIGHPLVSLCDNSADHVTAAINLLRSFARKEDMRAFIRHGGKSVGIYADSGFYLGNSAIRSRLLKMPWKKNKIGIVSALAPVEQIVEKLNHYQPSMLGGYPSQLELLIAYQRNGRLHITPDIIMTGGEYLSPQVRAALTEAFGCYVQTSYACTEGGTIACECHRQRLHLNDDWTIVEPVDAENRPVPHGVRADKLLLTNLFNFSQPFIRYEVTDRIILHREPCPCGNPSPWLEIEGRNDDVITLVNGGNTVKIPPLAVYATLRELPCLKRFQLIVFPGNYMELRLDAGEGISKEDAFLQGASALRAFLRQHQAGDIDIRLSPDPPMQHPDSGKFKHIINRCQTD